MDKITKYVTELCFALKRYTLLPYTEYMQSPKGHILMRRAGPVIASAFYTT